MASIALVPRRTQSLFSHLAETEEIISLIDALDDGNELTEASRDELSKQLIGAISGTRQKVDRVCAVLAQFEANVEAAKRETERLSKRQAKFEKASSRLADYVLAVLEASHLDTLDGETSGVARRKNPPKLAVDDESRIPWAFFRLPEPKPAPDPVPDNAAIKAALKADPASVPGCRLTTSYRLCRS